MSQPQREAAAIAILKANKEPHAQMTSQQIILKALEVAPTAMASSGHPFKLTRAYPFPLTNETRHLLLEELKLSASSPVIERRGGNAPVLIEDVLMGAKKHQLTPHEEPCTLSKTPCWKLVAESLCPGEKVTAAVAKAIKDRFNEHNFAHVVVDVVDPAPVPAEGSKGMTRAPSVEGNTEDRSAVAGGDSRGGSEMAQAGGDVEEPSQLAEGAQRLRRENAGKISRYAYEVDAGPGGSGPPAASKKRNAAAMTGKPLDWYFDKNAEEMGDMYHVGKIKACKDVSMLVDLFLKVYEDAKQLAHQCDELTEREADHLEEFAAFKAKTEEQMKGVETIVLQILNNGREMHSTYETRFLMPAQEALMRMQRLNNLAVGQTNEGLGDVHLAQETRRVTIDMIEGKGLLQHPYPLFRLDLSGGDIMEHRGVRLPAGVYFLSRDLVALMGLKPNNPTHDQDIWKRWTEQAKKLIGYGIYTVSISMLRPFTDPDVWETFKSFVCPGSGGNQRVKLFGIPALEGFLSKLWKQRENTEMKEGVFEGSGALAWVQSNDAKYIIDSDDWKAKYMCWKKQWTQSEAATAGETPSGTGAATEDPMNAAEVSFVDAHQEEGDTRDDS